MHITDICKAKRPDTRSLKIIHLIVCIYRVVVLLNMGRLKLGIYKYQYEQIPIRCPKE